MKPRGAWPLLFLLLLAPRPAAAPRAVIERASGVVEIIAADGAARAAHVGDAVREGARIRTGPVSLAILRLSPGGSRVVVGARSDLAFSRLSARSTEMNLAGGSVWSRAVLPREGEMRVTTPTGAAGVRGTRFSVLYSDTRAHVCNCEGLVEAVSPEGRATLRTAEFTELRPGGPAPAAMPERILLRRPPRDGSFDFCFTCHVEGGGGELKKENYFEF